MSSERLLNTFRDLVRYDNPSGQETLVVEHLRALLTDMGMTVEQDDALNLLARLPGSGEPLLLNAHTDCVSPCTGVQPVVQDGVVRSSGDTVLGADDLAGVAAIVEGVRRIQEAGTPHRALEIVFTSQEEVGLRGARAFDYRRLQAHEGVTFDMNGAVGGICLGSPSQSSIWAVVQGRAAHAGVAPEQGINAIRVAAEAIAAMPLGRIDAETTANIGTISGGEASNVVPPRVEMRGEVRSHNPASLEAQVAAMTGALEAAAARHGAKVDIHVSPTYAAYRVNEDAAFVQTVSGLFREMGIEPYTFVSGGGSDASIFAQHGLRMLNLSLGYRDIHTTSEHIDVVDIERITHLVTLLLKIEYDRGCDDNL